MLYLSERLSFAGADGTPLAARLDLPLGPVRATAIFAHCFTCSKDLFAAQRIADGLAGHGIAVLRFDFTGLGASGGEFANTNFSSNVADLRAAADFLRGRGQAPALMVGHSLGGAAVLAAAGDIPEVKAVATIGAPADAEHVVHTFAADLGRIEAEGEAEVTLAGRRFTIRRQFLEDLRAQRLADRIAALRRPLMILHAPTDEVVGIDNAAAIYRAARHPKSFVSLDGADHLLTPKPTPPSSPTFSPPGRAATLPRPRPRPRAASASPRLAAAPFRSRCRRARTCFSATSLPASAAAPARAPTSSSPWPSAPAPR